MRIIRAFHYSCQGLAAAWRGEAAFRQECLLALVLIPGSFWLGRTAVEIFLLCAVIVLVLIVELINSAIEALADLVSTDYHPLIAKAKDMASAAVLLGLLIAGGWWGFVIIDRFF